MSGPEPTEFDLGCFFHGFEGDVTPEKQPFKTCFECGHIYWTEEQLLVEFNDTQAESVEALFGSGDWVSEETDPDLVFFCAWCAHDF